MPISRVMNNPDGSTPVPPVGGGDVNGTLATSILGAQAGGPASAGYVERHQHFQSSALGLVNPQSPMAAEGMGQAIALEEASEASEELREEVASNEATTGHEAPPPPEAPEEVEQWLEENRAIVAPPERAAPKDEPQGRTTRPTPRHPRHR